jgi:hypothetical protein
MVEPLPEADVRERRLRAGFVPGRRPTHAETELDVLECGEVRDETRFLRHQRHVPSP